MFYFLFPYLSTDFQFQKFAFPLSWLECIWCRENNYEIKTKKSSSLKTAIRIQKLIWNKGKASHSGRGFWGISVNKRQPVHVPTWIIAYLAFLCSFFVFCIPQNIWRLRKGQTTLIRVIAVRRMRRHSTCRAAQINAVILCVRRSRKHSFYILICVAVSRNRAGTRTLE